MPPPAFLVISKGEPPWRQKERQFLPGQTAGPKALVGDGWSEGATLFPRDFFGLCSLASGHMEPLCNSMLLNLELESMNRGICC